MIAFLLMFTLVQTSPADTIQVNESHWRVYDALGNESSIEAVVEAAAAADVLFIGETHDDPVVHYLQRDLLEGVFKSQHQRGVALSMEMFTRDVQYIVDEYLQDLIGESQFLGASSPWPNYKTDYRPLVEFAKIHGVPVVAANAPRRYVNRVTRLGPGSLDALSDQARSYLAPLPYAPASEAYAAEWNALMEESMAEMAAAMRRADSTAAAMGPADSTEAQEAEAAAEEGATAGETVETQESEGDAEEEAPAAPRGPMHGGMSYMLDSQSLWDATMAYSIGEQLMRRPGSMAVHVVGAFHVEHRTGIPEHLARYRPGVKQVVVSVRPAEDVTKFDPEKHANLGDFVILADESLPRTHKR